MIAQAAGGTVSVTGEPDRPPVNPGPAFGDIGMLMAVTLGGLLERQRTGNGRRLQVAMRAAMIRHMRTCFAAQALRAIANSIQTQRNESSSAVWKRSAARAIGTKVFLSPGFTIARALR